MDKSLRAHQTIHILLSKRKMSSNPRLILITLLLLVSFSQGNLNAQGRIQSTDGPTIENDHWVYSDIVKDSFCIKIFLPEKYNQKEERKYPVIYMTDGDRYFGLVTDFVYSLLHREGIDVIVVGIGYGAKSINNLKRRRDYKTKPDAGEFTGAVAFRDFIKKELFPIIESKYQIDHADRTLIGWSMAGTFTLNTMFKDPLLFNNYLVLSARLNYEEDPILEIEQLFSEENKDLKARLFYSMGNADRRYEQFPEFVRNLNGRGYKNLKFGSHELEGKSHDIIALSEGLGLGLQSIFIRKDITEKLLETLNTKGIKATIELYRMMKEEQSDEYDFREERLNELGYYLIEQNRAVESIEIFKLNAEAYPKSYNVYDSLGESYFLNKNYRMALLNYRKSLELNPENSNAEEMIKKLRAKR